MGLRIVVYEPLVIGTASIDTLTPVVDSYSHEIRADGGYWTCSFDIGGNRSDAEDWVFNGLGRDVRIYNEANYIIWRGFVNSVETSLGALSVKRGPLLDIGNRVSVKYQTPSFTIASVTIGGKQQTLGVANNIVSQGKYGIRQKEISAGTATTTEATQIQNTYLNEQGEPPITHTVTTGGSGGEVGIKISCMGYAGMLDYLPSDLAANGGMNLSDKLGEMITEDPNGILANTASQIETNTTQVAQYYGGDGQTALSIIKSLVALGGPSPGYERYTWGIDHLLRLTYGAIPTAYEYQYKVTGSIQQVLDLSGSQVSPWNIVPGKFLFISDFLVGRMADTSDPRTDPRIMFIETVKYTAPWGLALNGGRTTTVEQKLARLNLGGL